jgi:hypothetical protein
MTTRGPKEMKAVTKVISDKTDKTDMSDYNYLQVRHIELSP